MKLLIKIVSKVQKIHYIFLVSVFLFLLVSFFSNEVYASCSNGNWGSRCQNSCENLNIGACLKTDGDCFWYLGYDGIDKRPRCTSTYGQTVKACEANSQIGCYSDQECGPNNNICVKGSSTPDNPPPASNPNPGTGTKPACSDDNIGIEPGSGVRGVAQCASSNNCQNLGLGEYSDRYQCSDSTKPYCCINYLSNAAPPKSNAEQCTKHSDCGANGYCISNVVGKKGSSSCVKEGIVGTETICEDYTSRLGLGLDKVCASGKCNSTTLLCEGGTTAPPGRGGASAPSAPPAPGGYCGNDSGPNASWKTPNTTCSVSEARWDRANGNAYCNYYHSGSGEFFYGCSGGANPGTGSPAPSPTPYIPGADAKVCANQDGVAGYMQPLCDGQPFDASKVPTAKLGRTYSDRYKCNSADASGKDYFDKEIPRTSPGGDACDKFPWYNASASKKLPGIIYVYQNQTCGGGSNPPLCDPDLNLICVTLSKNSSGIDMYTCQYNTDSSKGPVGAPTPTPGASTRCEIGLKGTGCECSSTGGGCLTSHNCEPSADPGDSNSYCVPFPAVQKWCERTKTLVSSPAACTGATPYATPTPYYGSECPNDTYHKCASSTAACPATYAYKNSALADQACSAYEPSTPVCCKKATTGSGGPVVPSPITASPSPAAPAPETCAGIGGTCGFSGYADTHSGAQSWGILDCKLVAGYQQWCWK